MPDVTRIVTLSTGGRPVVALDLENGTTYLKARDTFKVTAGARQAQASRLEDRYGGTRPVAEHLENGTVAATWLVRGDTADAALDNIRALMREIEDVGPGRYIEWRPDGATRSTLYERRGPATWDFSYSSVRFSQTRGAEIVITFPVAPLAQGLPMDVADDFSVDSIADYTRDAGAVGDLVVTGGVLDAAANFTTEQRLIHTARGYAYGDHQATVKATPGATITSFKAGVVLKRTAATSYVEVYVDDNGTNSRLRIDVVTAGSRVNRSSTNLGARIVNATAFWVRGRIEASTVYAEYFLAANPPTPMVAPTTPASYALAGAEITDFGAAVTGQAGLVFIPQVTAAVLDELAIEPYVYRNQTLPATVSLGGAVPGDVPALVDFHVGHSGGAAAPIFALLGWTERPATGGADVPFGIIEAESGGNLSGWAAAADATARGGNRLADATVSGAETYAASYLVDPNILSDPDDFQPRELSLEVWARVRMSDTLVSPKLTLSARPSIGATFGTERFSAEYGSTGKTLVIPSGGAAWRFVRLGTLLFTVDPARPRNWHLWLAGSTAAGSTGVFGLDYLACVLAGARSLSPTGRSSTSYPGFLTTTAEARKLIRSDLSGNIAQPPSDGYPDHGLGGALPRLPPGNVDLFGKLSSHVPDDPTAASVSEQLSHAATLHASVTPRYALLA